MSIQANQKTPEHHDHKDLRQTLATIEEDKQAALELLHELVLCERLEERKLKEEGQRRSDNQFVSPPQPLARGWV